MKFWLCLALGTCLFAESAKKSAAEKIAPEKGLPEKIATEKIAFEKNPGAEKKPAGDKAPAAKTVVAKAVAPKVAKPAAEAVCVDTPRIMARRNPVKKLELSEAMSKDLSGVLFGVSLNDQMELRVDMEAPSEDGASQLEKMVGLLVAAERLKSAPGEPVGIDLQKSSHIERNGKVVRTTVSLTDGQLEKLLEARYGRKLVAEAKARMVYVHGLYGGTKSYPWGDGLIIDLRR